MSGIYTSYLSAGDSDAGFSGNLWGRMEDCTTSVFGKRHVVVSDDFHNFGLTTAVTSNVGRYASAGGVYKSYEDTGGAISQLATHTGGVISIGTDNTDNDEVWLQAAGSTGVFGAISDTAGSSKLTIFETRFRLPQVTSTYNLFIGLAEEGLAAADTITDAGALASKDFFGFHVAESDGDALNFVYRLAGQNAVTKISGVQALAADTWYKAGAIFDPSAPASKRIKVYVGNTEQSTYVTATNIATATGDAFPDGEEMSFLVGVKNQTTTASTVLVDWFRYFQEG